MGENANELRSIDKEAIKIYKFWHDKGHGKKSLETIILAGQAESERIERHNKVGIKVAEERRIIFGENYDKVYLSNVKFIYENRVKIIKWREHYGLGICDPAQLRQKYRTFLGKKTKIKDGMLQFKKLYIQERLRNTEGEAIDKKSIVADAKNKVRELKTLTNRNIDLADKMFKSVVGKKKTEKKKATMPKIGDSDDIAENMFARLKSVLDVAFDPDFTSAEDRNKVLTIVMEKFKLNVKSCEYGLSEQCRVVRDQKDMLTKLRYKIKDLRKKTPTVIPTPKRRKINMAINQ